MAKVVIIGAGFAGHTAALYLGHALGKQHDVTMINQSDRFLFVPSLVWVGVGRMDVEKTRFPLKPVYDRMHVKFVHGRATEIHPDDQYVVVERKDGAAGTLQVPYDYLMIATGPQLDFAATPGLGPDHANTYSICTSGHAVQAREQYLGAVARMQHGERQRIVIGTGHGGATCEGAAFEYVTNVHKDLVRRGVRDKADLMYLSNERAPGDFGVRGVHVKQKDRVISSEDFIRAVFKDYAISHETQKGVVGVEKNRIFWQDYDAVEGETGYDYAMLIPRFTGMAMKYIGRNGEDVSSKVVNAAGFVLVDGIYGLPYSTLSENPDAWPSVYQNPDLSQYLCGRHRLCAAGADLAAARQRQESIDQRRAAAHRHGVGCHRAHHRQEHHRSGAARPDDAP